VQATPHRRSASAAAATAAKAASSANFSAIRCTVPVIVAVVDVVEHTLQFGLLLFDDHTRVSRRPTEKTKRKA
jgi:hypothetical protein